MASRTATILAHAMVKSGMKQLAETSVARAGEWQGQHGLTVDPQKNSYTLGYSDCLQFCELENGHV